MRPSRLLVPIGLLLLAASTGCGPGGGGRANRPPTVTILVPSSGAILPAGEPVRLEARAEDPEEGTLGGDALVWTSDADGLLGRGEALRSAALSPGAHALTCRARDAEGREAADTVAVRVEEVTVTARPARPGDLVVTEIMVDVAGVPDERGEWFEIHNPGPRSLALDGLVVRDDDGQRLVVPAPYVIAPGGHFVLGVNADPAANGGVPVDYAYVYFPDGFQLANAADEVVLEVEGVTIDAVRYDQAAGWTITAGASLSLRPEATSATANDDPASWCQATTPYGPDDAGSPGAANPECP